MQLARLLGQSAHLLDHVPTGFHRFLHQDIRWANRLIGVKGARGTGKTTLLLQWLKEQHLPPEQAAYFSLDDLYFTTHHLKDTVDEFYRNGGKILVLDEVHKYPNWAQEIKKHTEAKQQERLKVEQDEINRQASFHEKIKAVRQKRLEQQGRK